MKTLLLFCKVANQKVFFVHVVHVPRLYVVLLNLTAHGTEILLGCAYKLCFVP
jgi:hypothetical protein